jgi:hypothetical protein
MPYKTQKQKWFQKIEPIFVKNSNVIQSSKFKQMTSLTKKRVTFDTLTKKNDGLSFENASFDELVNACLCNNIPFKEALKRSRIAKQKSKVIKKMVVWLLAYFELSRQYPDGIIKYDANGNEEKWKLPVLRTGGGNNIAATAKHFNLIIKLKKEVDEYQLIHYSVKKIQTIFKKCIRLKRKNLRINLNLHKRRDLKIKDAMRYGAKWDHKTSNWYVKKTAGVGGRLAIIRFGVKKFY